MSEIVEPNPIDKDRPSHDETIDIEIRGKIYRCGPLYWDICQELFSLPAQTDNSYTVQAVALALHQDYDFINADWLSKRLRFGDVQKLRLEVYPKLMKMSGFDMPGDDASGEATAASPGTEISESSSPNAAQEDSSEEIGIAAAAE